MFSRFFKIAVFGTLTLATAISVGLPWGPFTGIFVGAVAWMGWELGSLFYTYVTLPYKKYEAHFLNHLLKIIKNAYQTTIILDHPDALLKEIKIALAKSPGTTSPTQAQLIAKLKAISTGTHLHLYLASACSLILDKLELLGFSRKNRLQILCSRTVGHYIEHIDTLEEIRKHLAVKENRYYLLDNLQESQPVLDALRKIECNQSIDFQQTLHMLKQLPTENRALYTPEDPLIRYLVDLINPHQCSITQMAALLQNLDTAEVLQQSIGKFFVWRSPQYKTQKIRDSFKGQLAVIFQETPLEAQALSQALDAINQETASNQGINESGTVGVGQTGTPLPYNPTPGGRQNHPLLFKKIPEKAVRAAEKPAPSADDPPSPRRSTRLT